MVKKTIIIIVIVVGLLLCVMFSLYFINGSLEIEPTEEQNSKVRLIMGFLATLTFFISLSFFYILKKISKK